MPEPVHERRDASDFTGGFAHRKLALRHPGPQPRQQLPATSVCSQLPSKVATAVRHRSRIEALLSFPGQREECALQALYVILDLIASADENSCSDGSSLVSRCSGCS